MISYLSDKKDNATGICFLDYQQCVEHLNNESHKARFRELVRARIYSNIVFLSTDTKVDKDNYLESLSFISPQIKDSITDFIYYSEDKVGAIKNYTKEHNLEQMYIVLDDDNLLVDFAGLFFSTHEEAMNTSINQLQRIKHEGFWWSFEDRNIVENRHREIDYDGYKSVIFLDIDGVLNEEDYCDRRKVHEERVERLAKIVHATGAEIVLSSSWRRGVINWFYYEDDRYQNDPPSQLLTLLGKYHMSISDITADLYSGHMARPLEIRTWLTNRPELLNFVILDDEDFWSWNWLGRFFVKTRIDKENGRHIEWIQGLNDENVQQAIEILNIVKPKR